MRKLFVPVLLLMILLAACGNAEETTQEAVYMNISAEEAKGIMDSTEGYIILDVRTQAEFEESHIPGAILIPDTEIEEKAESIDISETELVAAAAEYVEMINTFENKELELPQEATVAEPVEEINNDVAETAEETAETAEE